MNLTQLCGGLDSSLSQLEAARRGAQDGEAIDQRRQQWGDRLSTLQSARQRAIWLQVDLSRVPPFEEQFAHTQRLADQAAKLLVQHADISALTEDNLWVRLLQTAQNAADTAWEHAKRAWSVRVEQFHQLTSPQQLRITASPLPQNEAVLVEYEIQYRSASRLAGLETPKSANDPDTLSQSIDRCRELASRLRFDAPKDVEEFFRAINEGRATLVHVTKDVLTWLADNGQLGAYTVRSSSR
jgi:hypothetical protein